MRFIIFFPCGVHIYVHMIYIIIPFPICITTIFIFHIKKYFILYCQLSIPRVQGWGLLSQFSPFRYCPHFPILSKQALAIEHCVYIWQVSPQLSCGDTCQIWMWFRESNRYFCRIEKFAYGEISERSFSNPHPWYQKRPVSCISISMEYMPIFVSYSLLFPCGIYTYFHVVRISMWSVFIFTYYTYFHFHVFMFIFVWYILVFPCRMCSHSHAVRISMKHVFLFSHSMYIFFDITCIPVSRGLYSML